MTPVMSKKNPKETTYEWERLNDVKAIWLRNLEVAEEEYTKFYHSLAKDFGDEKPMAWSHFNAEGDVEFKAVLFVPSDLYESYYNANKSNLKLYVRRVFIYRSYWVCRFTPYNNLKTINKLLRKALDMIRKLAEEDP